MDSQALLYLAQASYALTLASFALRNITGLRLLAILSSVAAITYSLEVAGGPLWVPVAWNVLFIALNLFQLLLTRWRSRAVALDPLETFLSKTILSNFPPAEVKSFTAFASGGELAEGQRLIQEGTKIDQLYCILKGRVDIYTQGKKIAELTAGHFVGEMSLLTRSHTRADVIAAENLRLLVWKHADIERWVNSDAARLTHLQTALGTQVVEQLLGQAAASNVPEGGGEEKAG